MEEGEIAEKKYNPEIILSIHLSQGYTCSTRSVYVSS
jgi:hypothetical protein